MRLPTVRRLALFALCLSGLILVGGCGTKQRLETGYAYRPLNSSDGERRAYYLDTYSIEAVTARSAGNGSEGLRNVPRPR